MVADWSASSYPKRSLGAEQPCVGILQSRPNLLTLHCLRHPTYMRINITWLSYGTLRRCGGRCLYISVMTLTL